MLLTTGVAIEAASALRKEPTLKSLVNTLEVAAAAAAEEPALATPEPPVVPNDEVLPNELVAVVEVVDTVGI
jgi:hypothetical protein